MHDGIGSFARSALECHRLLDGIVRSNRDVPAMGDEIEE
jgi:hypothetical protein